MKKLLAASCWLLAITPAWAAWGFVATLGSAQIKTSGTNNLVITTSATAEVNNVIVCALGGDNISTTDGQTTHWSVTDSAGNSYTRAKEYENTKGSAGGGVVSGIYFSKVTTQLTSGGTITFTSDTAVTAKAAECLEYTITSSNVVSVEGSNFADGDSGSDPQAITISSLPSQEYLWFHGLGYEGPNTDTFTWDSDYTAHTGNGTTGASSSTNALVRSGHRIFTGTTDTVDVASNTADNDNAQTYVALKETAPPAVTAGPRQVIVLQ